MSAIITRLTNQLMAKGMMPSQARTTAVSQLQKNGILREGTEQLTEYGAKRNAMSPGERAKDRAAKYSGKHSPSDYDYNRKTNMATLKKR